MNMQMVRTKRQVSALVLTGVIVTGGFTAWVLACGPFSDSFETFVTFEPAHRSEFGRGQLSVVSPEYARRYLVQAYRVFSGQPALPNAALTTAELHAGVEMSDSPDHRFRTGQRCATGCLAAPPLASIHFDACPNTSNFGTAPTMRSATPRGRWTRASDNSERPVRRSAIGPARKWRCSGTARRRGSSCPNRRSSDDRADREFHVYPYCRPWRHAHGSTPELD